MYKILKLNKISDKINNVFNGEYEVGDKVHNPDAILVRSADMHNYEVNENLVAVGRAGAGVNNIPHADYIRKGIVVFNTPGANANAVKELVLTSLLLCGRNITGAVEWVKQQKGKGEEIPALVEKNKARFVGREITGKTLGIIGVGAIGALVAEAVYALGMEVYGFDPFLNPDTAHRLEGKVTFTDDIGELYAKSDYITIHVPYTPATKYMINKEAFSMMKKGVNVINLARGELVNNADMITAVKNGDVAKYVCDFPTEELIDVENVITVPHLGASTPEAEDNCAVMAAGEIADYLENGNIRNSVNFPGLYAPRTGRYRICILAENINEVMPSVNELLGRDNVHLTAVNSSTGKNSAYIMIGTDSDIYPSLVKDIEALDKVYKVRVIGL